MFDIGSYPAKTCAGVSRRSFLRVAASAPLALGLPGAGLAAAAQAKARAKSVIFVFLWGGPSHLDTCDPKPDAPSEYRGPFGVIPTRGRRASISQNSCPSSPSAATASAWSARTSRPTRATRRPARWP